MTVTGNKIESRLADIEGQCVGALYFVISARCSYFGQEGARMRVRSTPFLALVRSNDLGGTDTLSVGRGGNGRRRQPIVMNRATDGMRSPSTMNSMYGPGGAIAPLAGKRTSIPAAVVATIGSRMRRCPESV